MARRLLPFLILACAALAAPAAAAGAADLHRHSDGAHEPRTGKEALREAKAVMSGEGVKTGRELSLALRSLVEKLPELDGADRRRAERLLARPTQGEANPGESSYDVPSYKHCGEHFCIHYVEHVSPQGQQPPPPNHCRHPADDRPPGADEVEATVPPYVQTMLAEFEHVHRVENQQLGWRPPKPDFGKGGDNRTDVYIKNIGPEGIFGYAAADAGQPLNEGRSKLAAYLVMDNDYCQQEFRNYPHFVEPLQVTAAHEYNHVLQFNYDALQDNWMFESTAVWMEDKVYDDINDYRNYLPAWAKLTLAPLTRFDQQPQSDNPNNAKAYGDVVFVRWIDERYGPDTIRRAWDYSLPTRSFAPAAFQAALRERGTTLFDVFTAFAPDTAEWRLAGGPFDEGSEDRGFPDVQRALRGEPLQPQTVTRQRNDYVEGGIDHTAYALFNVDPSGEDRITVGATFRPRIRGAIALVGRTGDERSGTHTVRLKRLPRGGAGRVTLTGARDYSRVTAVLINAHTAKAGYSETLGDWLWKGDDEPITLAVNDFTKPVPRKLVPKRNARRVSTGANVKVVFNEGVTGISTRSVQLVGPRKKKVRVTFSQSRNGKILKIKPTGRLARNTRYTVKLTGHVTDGGGNKLPTSRRSWRFTTGR